VKGTETKPIPVHWERMVRHGGVPLVKGTETHGAKIPSAAESSATEVSPS